MELQGGDGVEGTSEQFEEEEKIEPFRTHGRICVLSPVCILTQFGPAIKMVELHREERHTDPSSVDDTTEEEEEKPGSFAGISLGAGASVSIAPYTIQAHYEVEMDGILTFDVCPTTGAMITAHKSGCQRKWDLAIGLETVLWKRKPTERPVSLVEINKIAHHVQFSTTRPDEDEPSALMAQTGDQWQIKTDVVWAVVGGTEVSFHRIARETHKPLGKVDLDEETSISLVKWDTSSAARQQEANNDLIVAGYKMYVIRVDDNTSRIRTMQVLSHHNSRVTGIEWFNYCEDDSECKMISTSADRTFAIWYRGPGLGDHTGYIVQSTHALTETISSSCILSQKYLCLATTNGLLHVDLSTHHSETKRKNSPDHKLVTRQTLWWRNGPITGLYRSLSSRPEDLEQREEMYITCASGLVSCAKIVTTEDEAKGKESTLGLVEEYPHCLSEILAIKIWEQSANRIKIVVANGMSLITVYDMEEPGKLVRLDGHLKPVVTLATKGDYLASGSKDKSIVIWKADDLKPLHILKGHQGAVVSVCMGGREDGMNVYSVGTDLDLIKWEISKDRDVKPLTRVNAHKNEIHAVDVSPNNLLVVTCSQDKSAKLWDASTLELVHKFAAHKKTVWDVKFSRWDRRIITSSADSTVKTWHIDTKECLMTLQGHEGSVTQAFFINKGLQALSVALDGQCRVWNTYGHMIVPTTACVFECSEEPGEVVIDSLPDASMVLAGIKGGVLKRWKDITATVREEKLKTRQKKIEDTQILNNLIAKEDWKKVFIVSIKLDRPATTVRAIRGIGGHDSDYAEINGMIKELPKEAKESLSRYAKMWQTSNASMFEGYLVAKALALDFSKTRVPVLTSGFEERHMQRLMRRAEQVALIEHFAAERENDSS